MYWNALFIDLLLTKVSNMGTHVARAMSVQTFTPIIYRGQNCDPGLYCWLLQSGQTKSAKQNSPGVYVRHRPETTLLYQVVHSVVRLVRLPAFQEILSFVVLNTLTVLQFGANDIDSIVNENLNEPRCLIRK